MASDEQSRKGPEKPGRRGFLISAAAGGAALATGNAAPAARAVATAALPVAAAVVDTRVGSFLRYFLHSTGDPYNNYPLDRWLHETEHFGGWKHDVLGGMKRWIQNGEFTDATGRMPETFMNDLRHLALSILQPDLPEGMTIADISDESVIKTAYELAGKECSSDIIAHYKKLSDVLGHLGGPNTTMKELQGVFRARRREFVETLLNKPETLPATEKQRAEVWTTLRRMMGQDREPVSPIQDAVREKAAHYDERAEIRQEVRRQAEERKEQLEREEEQRKQKEALKENGIPCRVAINYDRETSDLSTKEYKISPAGTLITRVHIDHLRKHAYLSSSDHVADDMLRYPAPNVKILGKDTLVSTCDPVLIESFNHAIKHTNGCIHVPARQMDVDAIGRA